MTYTPRHRPYAHQAEALRRMKGQKAYALLMAMRTGKTKTLLDDWGRLVTEGQCDDLLVIAPAGVYRTWLTAIAEHLSADLFARTAVGLWVSGPSAREKRNLSLLLKTTGGPRILLANIEALSSIKLARETVTDFARQRRCMIAVDESTTIKNPSAERTKFIVKALGPLGAYRRILTGLISPRSPLDVYSQFQFLDQKILGFSSYYAFRARYGIIKPMLFGGRNVPVVVGYRDVEELRERIEPYSFRVRLEDCYDLPPKDYSFREVLMTDEQRKVYEELRAFASSALSATQHVSATQVITQILRMHQVLCGHVRDEAGFVHELKENRTRELLSLLEEYDGKAIIWCSYDHDIRKVSAALEKEYGEGSVARFWGGNNNTRESEEKLYLTDPACRFMVATAAAGGRGRTWVNANLVVYYSSTNDLEHRSQSEERAQGVGKNDRVAYVDMIVRGTVEEKIIKALREKINVASVINGDNYREWLI